MDKPKHGILGGLICLGSRGGYSKRSELQNLGDYMGKSYSEWDFDVVVIGAGGAGLRAAIEASSNGAKVGMISKSMLGKAHTVMAEGCGCRIS